MLSDVAGNTVAERPLHKADQLVSLHLGAVREDFKQVLLKTRRGFVQAAPGRGDDGPNILIWSAIAQLARVQVKDPFACAQQPGVGIPVTRGDAQVGLGIGQHRLCAPQRLEGFGTFDEGARGDFEPFIVFDAWIIDFPALEEIRIELLFGLGCLSGKPGTRLHVLPGQVVAGHQQRVFRFVGFPVVALPLVPQLFRVIVDALTAEEMRVQPGISLFAVAQAVQHEIDLGFGYRDITFLTSCRSFPSKWDDLPLSLWSIHLGTVGESNPNGALPIDFATPGRAIPLLAAIESRSPKQSVYAVGIFARPERQQMAQRQVCLRWGGIAGRIALPQGAESYTIARVHGLLK